jgi:phosphoglycolate phosphatase
VDYATPAPIRAVLLDKDGTLVDFRASWIPAFVGAARTLCTQRQLPPGSDARLLELGGYDPARGYWEADALIACGSTLELARAWASAIPNAGVSQIQAFLEDAFDRGVRAEPIAVAGSHGVLERLRKRGIMLGVATMDTERGARDTLQRLGIASLFSFVCGCDSGFGEKPAPGMVEAFCAHVSVRAAEIAVVGDTTHDCVMGARSGAAMVVGVLSGASGRDVLAPHCHHVLDSVADLEAIL